MGLLQLHTILKSTFDEMDSFSTYQEFNVIDRNKNGLIESSEIHNLSLAELDGMFDGEEPGSVSCIS